MQSLNRSLPLLLALALAGLCGAGCTKELRKSRHLGRANRYFQALQYEQAEIEYFQVLQVAPLNSEAIRQLGIIYQEQGKTTRANAYLVKAAALETNNLDVHLKLALNCLALGDLRKASSEAAWVLAKQPGQPDALEVLAQSPPTLQALQDSQQKIEKMRQADKDRAGYHVAFANLYYRRQDLTNAEIEFKKALELDPKSPAALLGLGGIYWGRNDLAAADQMLKAAADASPVRSYRRLRYAEFKLRNGKLDEAKRYLEETTHLAPDYLPAWNALAQIAFAEKKYDQCNLLLKQVLSRDSFNYDALMLDGTMRLVQADATKAVAAFTRMSKTYSHSPQVQLQLARAYLLNGDATKAIASLNQAVAANTNFSEAILLLANLNIRRGDPSLAVASLTELLKKQPRLPEAHLLLVDAYLARKEPDQALTECRHMAELFPKAAEVPMLAGSLLERQNKLTEARQSFEKVLELAPNYMPAIEQIVRLDLSEKKFPAANERVQKQIDKNPKAAEPWLLLARIHLDQAQALVRAEGQKKADASRPIIRLADVPAAKAEVDQAEAALLKAIDLNPDIQGSYLMLADLYSSSGKQQQALDRLNGLLAKTNNAFALMQVALLQQSQTNYPAARDAYEKLLVLKPDFSPALNNLAFLYSEHLGDLDKADQLAEKARKMLPDDPATADTLGWILSKRGEYPRALGLLQESATKLPSDPDVQFHLGITHYKAGDERPARVALQAAAQGARDFSGKKEAIRLLALLDIDPKLADAAALSALESQLRDNPHDSIALARLGAIQQRDGALEKAADSYQTALKYNPQNSEVTYQLAELYSSPRLNNPQKAIALAKTAHDLAPNNPHISALLGRLVFRSGDYTWAASLLEDTARQLPADPQVNYDLAWAYYSLGRVAEAQSVMQAVSNAGATFPKAEDATRFLSALAASSDPTQAAQFAPEAQKILSADPTYVPALMVSAIAQEGQGKYEGAAQSYNQILARYPLFTPATRNLGLVYFAHLGNDQRAYDLIAKARDAFPQDAALAKALGILTYRKADYSRAAGLLKESALSLKDDPELLAYLGMAQYQLKAKADSKASLQQAVALNVQGKLAQEAKRILAELK